MTRLLWSVAAGLALCLGVVGIALPLIPTVPFLLLTAFCLSRVSDVWHRRLLYHPRLGPPIRDWQTRRAISRSTKWRASIGMAALLLLSIVLNLDVRIIAMQFIIMAAVAAFLWTRPE